jgi:hypothetical protein
MTAPSRKSPVSQQIYRKHIQLFRFLNDAWIFTHLLRPDLDSKATELRNSTSKKKNLYTVPKRRAMIGSLRTDQDLGDVFRAQCDRGIFETNIVSVISRVEAFLQDCLAIVITHHPGKLAILGDKGIPLDLFLEHPSRDDLFEAIIALRCQELLFAKPKDYLSKLCKVLSIEIREDILDHFIEAKASRDVIIHNRGAINKLYIEKAGTRTRGQVGEELVIDEQYFSDVIENTKLLSGAIQRETEKKYK